MQPLAHRSYSHSTIVSMGPFYRQNIQILAPLSFPLISGQWTAIIGRSGVGKTTFLRCLAGLEASQPIHHSLKVSYIPQRDTLLPWKNVAENIALGPLLQGKKIDNALIDHFLTMIDLKGYENYYPHQLSQGMRQRIALARSLFDEADVILMDEPFSSLDGLTRSEIHKIVKTLLTGKIVVLVTHDVHEAFELADQIYLLKDRPGVLMPVERRSPQHLLEALIS
jgi:putative hydroxymethylpyrimidine transport system ATP-binding protein